MRLLYISLIAATLPIASSAQRIVPVGTGVFGVRGVFDALVFDDQLILGGRFGSFNGHVRPNLQGWDGTNHYDHPGAFEEGISTPVHALVIHNGELIAGGIEPNFANIARWDGAAWQMLGGGLSSSVSDLVVHQGMLYAASGNGVYEWNGNTWIQLIHEFNGPVYALATHEGQLYTAGEFDHSADGTIELRHIARLEGGAWVEPASGVDGYVYCLTSTSLGLAVGGSFTLSGNGVPLPAYGILNSDQWSVPNAQQPYALVHNIMEYPSGGLLLGIKLGESQGTARYISAIESYDHDFPWPTKIVNFNGDNYIVGRSTWSGTPWSFTPVNRIGIIKEGTDHAYLDINNISACVRPMLNQFTTPSSAGFEVPKGDSTHTIYAASPMIIGEVNGELHSAATLYDGMDFTWENPVLSAGPHADMQDLEYFHRYYQVWKVDKQQLIYHAAHFSDPDYAMPFVIENWPAHGDISNGEPAHLAPFADLNNDGQYQPMQGEYPLIRGDQAVYTLVHSIQDADSLHPPMKLDIHIMHYAFDQPLNQDLEHTVFTNYKIINRGSEYYTDVRFGQFVDFALGNSYDDLVGCDSLLNLFFTYNGDDLDEDSFYEHGYAEQPPAQGCLFLNEPMTSFRTAPNEGPVGSIPTLEDLLNGTLNGDPFMQLGYPTHFQFPGGTWIDAFDFVDRRGVGSIGPYSLSSGDTLCVDLAYPYARSITGGAIGSREAMRTRAVAIRDWYAGYAVDCDAPSDINVAVREGKDPPFRLWPNPTTGDIMVNLGYANGPFAYRIFDIAGSLVTSGKNEDLEEVSFLDLAHLANGTYLLRIDQGNVQWFGNFLKITH